MCLTALGCVLPFNARPQKPMGCLRTHQIQSLLTCGVVRPSVLCVLLSDSKQIQIGGMPAAAHTPVLA